MGTGRRDREPDPRPVRRRARAGAACAMLLAASCGGGGTGPLPQASPYPDPGYVSSPHGRLHYALTPTRDLPPATLARYGIPPQAELALLTVSLVPTERKSGPGPETVVEASAVSLTGVRRSLELRRLPDAGHETWLATVPVRHRVPVTIEIRARTARGQPPIGVRFTRELRLE